MEQEYELDSARTRIGGYLDGLPIPGTYIHSTSTSIRVTTSQPTCATHERVHLPVATMSAIPKTFWSSPIRYLKWASYEKPAIFYSVILGCMGPVALVVIPPMRRWAGDQNPPMVPLTYPSKWTDYLQMSTQRRIMRSIQC